MAAVIGDPVEHSLSPVLHNAAFAELGIDWIYVAFRVTAGQAAAAVEAMRTLDLAGLSVTMPHKADVAQAVDRLAPVATELGVVNTVCWSSSGMDSDLVGESTDGPGFLDSLRGDEGFDPAGRTCLVLGSGGAARAVTQALGSTGPAEVIVAGRNSEAAQGCAALAGPAGRAVLVTEEAPASLADAIGAADLIVNATPVGMLTDARLPFALDEAWLKPSHFVADLIYAPATTPLLAAARRAGAQCCNGIGMLIHQAARQLELWTGRPAPLEGMSAAAVAELTHRRD